MHRRVVAAVALLPFTSVGPIGAQEALSDSITAIRAELAALKESYEQQVAAVEKRLQALEAATTGGAIPPPPATETVAAVPAPPAASAAAPTTNYFNPAIAMIGNVLGVAGSNHVENLPNAELRESELGLQAIIDPYARADFFLAFGEGEVEVEEGYITLTSLPADLLVKVGRMRPYFGKVNTFHLHTLPWADQPLPVVNLLGSDEGWIGTGVSIAKLLPIGDTFSELTLQAFGGDAEGLFAGESRSDLSYNAHYRLFRDLTETTNLDLGLSYGFGPNGSAPDADTRIEALDATFRWRPLRRAGYRAAVLRGEIFRSRRERATGEESAVGWFVAGDYHLAKRWIVGARLEESEQAEDSSLQDTGEAALLTFLPSEFLQLRGELRRRRYASIGTADELLLQLQFAIGAHGAHTF